MLDVNGDYSFGDGPGEFLVDTPATVAQAIQTRLLLWQGEWFLDSTVGTPYYSQILGYNTEAAYDGAIQAVILNTLGVNSITSYSSSVNPVTRSLIVNATVDTIYGPTEVTVNL
jgi:hypothetical protein